MARASQSSVDAPEFDFPLLSHEVDANPAVVVEGTLIVRVQDPQ